MINERGEILIYQKDFKFERMIKGTFGAVRDLAFNKEYIYTVSIDRFLRFIYIFILEYIILKMLEYHYQLIYHKDYKQLISIVLNIKTQRQKKKKKKFGQ